MLRVLLVLEDYGEMVFLQILLHKLGFDVDTIKNPKALTDSLYKMRPDVVVLTARGRRVNGVDLSHQIKKIVPKASVLMVAAAPIHDRLTQVEIQSAAAVLLSPVNPREFIETLSRLHNLDAASLLDKYKRMKAQIEASSAQHSGAVHEDTSATAVVPAREKYKKYLTLDQPPQQQSFSAKKMAQLTRELRKEPLDHELDKERQNFVKALFKKSS